MIQQVDYLICPCSYSKYVRRWVNGKQTIIACHYSYLPDSSTLNEVFGHYKYKCRPGLIYNPAVTVLGAKYPPEGDPWSSSYDFKNDDYSIIENINQITPEEIFNTIKY